MRALLLYFAGNSFPLMFNSLWVVFSHRPAKNDPSKIAQVLVARHSVSAGWGCRGGAAAPAPQQRYCWLTRQRGRGGRRPPKTLFLLLLFASEAGKKKHAT